MGEDGKESYIVHFRQETIPDPSDVQDELMADWELAVAGDEPFRIAPLQ